MCAHLEDSPRTKRCGRCGEQKPLDEFHRRRQGHYHRCKACMRDIYAQKKLDPEYVAKKQASYHRWLTANREQERARARRRNWTERGMVDLDWCEDVLLRDVCAYCGGPADSVDHIDPDLALGTWENFTAACRPCNSAKQQTPLLTFLLERAPA